jgi:hypothetical protein
VLLFYIIKRILFLLVVLLTLLQVTGNNPEEAIVKVAEGNVLKEKPQKKQSSLEKKKVDCIS